MIENLIDENANENHLNSLFDNINKNLTCVKFLKWNLKKNKHRWLILNKI